MRNSDSGRPPRPRKEATNKTSSSSKKPFSTDRASYPNQRREDDRKPFGEKKPFSNDRPFQKRDDDRKPFGEKKPFSNDRPFQKRDDDRKQFGEKKPFSNDRPFQKRDDDRKPFGEKKPFSNDRPFQKRDDDRKPFGEKKPFSNDRPFQKRDDDRKPFGEKKPFSNDRPFQRRDDDRKPFGEKSKSFSDEKPAHPFKKRDESGRATSNDRKNAYSADKPRFQKNEPFKPKENQATSSRINAPDYDEEKLRSKLPEKVQKKLLKEEKTSSPNDTIRLNRYISNAGIASRRDADELIASGQITVNGKEITEMGYKVKPDDVVKYGKKILNREKLVYLLLNKPKDFITTTEDPDERRTVMDLVKNACPERIYPVGRLDRNTTGLLLLTNDGELAEKLSHPSNEIKKIYQAELDKPISIEDFEAISNGIELEDGFIKPDELALVTPDAEVVGIKIHSGKNRIVRRIFESLGYEVMKLDRTTYAGLDKKDLPRGKWRFLTEKEVIRLKYMI
ncbi:pseudouridine synthase [Emticicia sp. SJ17W-69]|uniref:pseudouridine synthase n=1 Tax=Emticicia sp. SJ17W-69 TaxID=3421657 RepID=UPI003EBE6B22